MRALIAIGLLVAAAPAARGQDTPAFEVASVRPNTGSDNRSMTTWSADGRFRSMNITVRRLIELAYNLRSGNQPTGAPGWIASERFDIDAIPAVRVPRDQQRLMLQGLLRDRFGLVMREQPVDVPVYALVRTNPNTPLPRAMRESTVKCSYEGLTSEITMQREARGESLTGNPRCDGVRVLARGHIVSANGLISTLAADLAPYVDRRIVDRTGLTERYDFELRWTSDPGNDRVIANAGLFSAIQELGLKLQPILNREVGYVIERVQRPTPN
jgi:uncharacterized protein (TIGR03435 family)